MRKDMFPNRPRSRQTAPTGRDSIAQGGQTYVRIYGARFQFGDLLCLGQATASSFSTSAPSCQLVARLVAPFVSPIGANAGVKRKPEVRGRKPGRHARQPQGRYLLPPVRPDEDREAAVLPRTQTHWHAGRESAGGIRDLRDAGHGPCCAAEGQADADLAGRASLLGRGGAPRIGPPAHPGRCRTRGTRGLYVGSRRTRSVRNF